MARERFYHEIAGFRHEALLAECSWQLLAGLSRTGLHPATRMTPLSPYFPTHATNPLDDPGRLSVGT
jgi:hypothetical protein